MRRGLGYEKKTKRGTMETTQANGLSREEVKSPVWGVQI